MSSGWVVALDKHLGVSPVGVGENWRLLMVKFVLRMMGQEAKAACGTEQLYGGVEAGIRGGGPFYAPPMSTALPGGGMGVPPR